MDLTFLFIDLFFVMGIFLGGHLIKKNKNFKKYFIQLLKTFKFDPKDYFKKYFKNFPKIYVWSLSIVFFTFLAYIGHFFINISNSNITNYQYLLSTLAQSQAALLGIILSLTLVAIQLVSQTFSLNMVKNFIKDKLFWAFISLYLISIFYDILFLGILPDIVNDSCFIGVFLAIFLSFVCFLFLFPYAANVLTSMKAENIITSLVAVDKNEIFKEFNSDKKNNRRDDSLKPLEDVIKRFIEYNDVDNTVMAIFELEKLFEESEPIAFEESKQYEDTVSKIGPIQSENLKKYENNGQNMENPDYPYNQFLGYFNSKFINFMDHVTDKYRRYVFLQCLEHFYKVLNTVKNSDFSLKYKIDVFQNLLRILSNYSLNNHDLKRDYVLDLINFFDKLKTDTLFELDSSLKNENLQKITLNSHILNQCIVHIFITASPRINDVGVLNKLFSAYKEMLTFYMINMHLRFPEYLMSFKLILEHITKFGETKSEIWIEDAHVIQTEISIQLYAGTKLLNLGALFAVPLVAKNIVRIINSSEVFNWDDFEYLVNRINSKLCLENEPGKNFSDVDPREISKFSEIILKIKKDKTKNEQAIDNFTKCIERKGDYAFIKYNLEFQNTTIRPEFKRYSEQFETNLINTQSKEIYEKLQTIFQSNFQDQKLLILLSNIISENRENRDSFTRFIKLFNKI